MTATDAAPNAVEIVMDRPVRRERVSLRVKFLLWFVPVISIVVVGALGVVAYLNYTSQQDLLRTRAELIARLQASALAKPMWELDTVQITTLVGALSKDPDYLGSAVLDPISGEVMNNHDLSLSDQGYVSGVIDPTASHIRITEPIVYQARDQEEVLGQLLLVLSTKTIDHSLRLVVTIGAVAFVFLLASIIGIVFTVLQGMVFRPLNLMLSAISSVERKEWAGVDWHSSDELGKLVNSFNHMVTGLEDGDRAQKQLVDSEERYALAMSGANDGLWDWDLRTGAMYFSPRWNAMIGLPETDATLTDKEWLDRVHPEDRERVRREIEAHISGRTPTFSSEHRLLHRDGSYRWVLGRGLAVRDDGDGRAYRMAGSLTDITERKKAEEALLHNAFHDSLTGLPNRALMMDRVSMSLNRAKRDEEQRMAVLFIDFDRFKMVNDSLGHMAGDQMLIVCAQRLKTCLRDTDTIARFGGDEFVILLEDMENESQAIACANRIHDELSKPLDLDGQEVFTSASIGIVFGGPQYAKPEELLRDADIALYEAKATGRAKHVVFDTEMHAQAVNMLKIDADLRRAIERDEIEVFYQPLVSLSTGRLTGFEALSRWRHPDRGIVPPSEFIPVAEETGLIAAIGERMIDMVCHQLSRWHDEYPEFADLSVSLNCSPNELRDHRYIDRFRATLDRYPVRREMIKVEITESAIMDDPNKMADRLHGLEDLGLRLWLDDFGTGHSSLGQLDLFPFHGIKIDRSFVSPPFKELKERPGVKKPTLVGTIVALAQSLRVATVAEGIETAQQFNELRELGVNQGQGFLFAKPVDRIAAEDFIRQAKSWRSDISTSLVGAPVGE